MIRADLFPILYLIVLTSICDTVNQLFLKSAINSLNISVSTNIFKVIFFMFKLLLTPRVWVSGIFALLSLCIWLFILSKADLNYAFSADSMHYVFIAFGSGLILKEKVDLKRWLGTICIVLGIVLVSLS